MVDEYCQSLLINHEHPVKQETWRGNINTTDNTNATSIWDQMYTIGYKFSAYKK
jgi:hypothetical protein